MDKLIEAAKAEGELSTVALSRWTGQIMDKSRKTSSLNTIS